MPMKIIRNTIVNVKADAIVNCQCNIESAPERCEQAENCMFYSYYKCSRQWKRLA